jgi:CelD/BcsL family acetyltransferase involved in cellulose biosynthesis
MRAELVEPDSPSWSAMLSEMRHDFYHLPAYVSFAARRQEPGAPLAFIAEDDGQRFLVPLIVHPIPSDLAGDAETLFDATGPRGYAGPLVSPESTTDANNFVDRAIDALLDTLRERAIVTAFIRLHPLLGPPTAALRRAGEVVFHGDSTSIDLTLPREELWRQTNHGHRLGISKATRKGYVARIDETWERFDGFVAVYQASMDRLGAVPFWRFSADYFRDLRETLGDRLHLCVVEVGGELAAAALLTEEDGIVEFHLSGTANEHLAASPSKLLIDYARSWAKGRGNDRFHLTGSLRAGDALSQLGGVRRWQAFVFRAGDHQRGGVDAVQSIDHAGGPDQYRSHGTCQADGVEVVDGAGELVG